MNLRPPVKKIDDLNDEWDEDCFVDYDSTFLDKELLKIPSLHAKYSRIRSHHKQVFFALEAEYKQMKELRREWMEGKSELETLEKYSWYQWQGQPVNTRVAQEARLAEDPVLTKILMKKKIHEIIIDQCEGYIKQLHDRNYAIRGAIDSRKFLKGHD